MALSYIDTNIIIRYLTKDDPVQSQIAQKFVDEVIDGKREVTLLDTVVFEAVSVLTSKQLYQLPRNTVR
jgi:predicted nucleic-acid-binding protein